MRTERFNVTGMTSLGCATFVARALRKMGGIRDVKVSFGAHDATVDYDETITAPDKIKLAVQGAGYGTDPVEATHLKTSASSHSL